MPIARRSRAWSALVAALIVPPALVLPPPAVAVDREPVPLVRFPFPRDDGTLTPYSFDLGYPLVSLVYDTLMWRDTQGEPKPWLATSAETSPDARRVTLRLAPGITWHDGRPLTAEDVVFTFDYVARHPHPWFTAELEAIDHVEAPDPATVVVHLRAPSPGFLDQPLSDLPILPKHLWAGLPPGQTSPPGLPVGSGPYRLVEYTPRTGYRFTSYDGYFRGTPAVKELEVPIMGDANRMLASLESGSLDMVPLSVADDRATQLEDLGLKVARGESYGGVELVFNTRTSPFDSMALRKAVGDALDLQKIARTFGNASAATTGFVHPDSAWAPGAVPEPDDRAPDRAAVEVALAPLRAEPLSILAPRTDPDLVRTAREVTYALDRAGVPASVVRADSETYLGALGGADPASSFQLAVWRSPPFASYDPDFLSRQFGSDAQLAPLNFAGYRSAAFDALARRIATATSVDQRRADVAAALKLLDDDAPVKSLYFPEAAFVYRPGVFDGWAFVKGTGILDKRSFVDQRPAPPTRPGISDQVPAGGDRGRSAWLWLLAVAFFVSAALVGGFALAGRFRS